MKFLYILWLIHRQNNTSLQESTYHFVPASMAGIFCTETHSSIETPYVSSHSKYRTISKGAGHSDEKCISVRNGFLLQFFHLNKKKKKKKETNHEPEVKRGMVVDLVSLL